MNPIGPSDPAESSVGDSLAGTTERPPTRRSAFGGALVLVVGIGGFLAWAALAPLSSTAIAPGVVAVDSKRKTVQHLDGGIIAELLVREGDRVAAGQVLVRLDDVEARALFGLFQNQYWSLAAQQARLLAEQDEAERLKFPADIAALRDTPAVAEILGGQQRIFASGRDAQSGRIDVLRQRVAQLRAQIGSLEARHGAGREQLALFGQEQAAVQ